VPSTPFGIVRWRFRICSIAMEIKRHMAAERGSPNRASMSARSQAICNAFARSWVKQLTGPKAAEESRYIFDGNGPTNTRGEYWTQLGNLLIASGKYDNVVIAPLAFSGSEVARWMRGGDFNGLLVETARQLQNAGYRVTDVLWTQGEADYVKGTSTEAYIARFLSMVDTLRPAKH
jgi:hypothetical protein